MTDKTETFVVPQGLLQALHRYLVTKPYVEVNQFVEGLEMAQLIPDDDPTEPDKE